jgi:hypothetical protein
MKRFVAFIFFVVAICFGQGNNNAEDSILYIPTDMYILVFLFLLTLTYSVVVAVINRKKIGNTEVFMSPTGLKCHVSENVYGEIVKREDRDEVIIVAGMFVECSEVLPSFVRSLVLVVCISSKIPPLETVCLILVFGEIFSMVRHWFFVMNSWTGKITSLFLTFWVQIYRFKIDTILFFAVFIYFYPNWKTIGLYLLGRLVMAIINLTLLSSINYINFVIFNNKIVMWKIRQQEYNAIRDKWK